MGHKHSSLHRHLRQHDIDHRPSRDLVTSAAILDGGGGGGGGTGTLNNSTTTPYYEIKSGGPLNFKRRLSVRNISIRRSFHVPKSKSKSRSRFKGNATTDDIAYSSSSAVPNGTSSTTNNNAAATSSSSNSPPSDPLNGTSSLGPVNTPPSSSTSVNHHNLNHLSTTTTVLPLSNNNSNNHHNNNSHNSNKSNRNGDKFVMERLRKSFRNSFRRKKDHIPESIKPHQWQSDEQSVKAGNCIFPVKYLGCVEVFESRGMQICEDALRRLRNSRRKATKGTLYVTGDGLRVVDDETKGLIVDQTIEKVSFCAPDRSHERGFSYICRDGTTRRWMCHGFHAARDSGERLSHAVGCAFAVCLERKQRRDKEAVTTVFDQKTATFTRTGSFRQTTITERLQDPQVAKPTEPPPLKTVHNPNARERPHASTNLLQRQGSLRGGPLNHASPFKRQLSLRIGIISDSLTATSAISNNNNNSITALPNGNGTTSTINHNSTTASTARERAHSLDFTSLTNSYDDNDDTDNSSAVTTSFKRTIVPNSLFSLNPKVTLAPSVAPIEEVSPSLDQPSPLISTTTTAAVVSSSNSVSSNSASSTSMITAMCQELSQGLTMLSAAAATTNEVAADRSALNSTTKGPETFSAFDKWISTNKVPTKAPLIPPPVVDQMPQVTAPPPPTSPSYATVTFPVSASEFSSVPSSNNNSNSKKIVSTIPTSSSLSSSSTISKLPPPSTTTSTIPKSQSLGSSMVDGNSDPFDAGWAELVNRHVFTSPSPSAITTSSSTLSMNSIVAATNTATTISNIPYKSTNPFLDLSQFNIVGGSGSSSSTDSSIFSSLTSGCQPTTTATTTVTTNILPTSQQQQSQQQMFKAFEVHM